MKVVTMKPTENGYDARHRKDDHFKYAVIGLIGGKKIVEVKFYRTNSRIYCCLTVNDELNNKLYAGSAYAGRLETNGAFEYALSQAGITLDIRIAYDKYNPIRETVCAILDHIVEDYNSTLPPTMISPVVTNVIYVLP